MLRIPFSPVPLPVLRKIAPFFRGPAQSLQKSFLFLKASLSQANLPLSAGEYIELCLASSSLFFLFLSALLLLVAGLSKKADLILPSLGVILLITVLVFVQQMAYPRLLVKHKIKDIEQNLLPALQDMWIQLNSGVPVFTVLVNISASGYGELSRAFGLTVREINAGKPQIDALEALGTNNPSVLFRRVIWQVLNGIKTGGEMSTVIEEISHGLAEEQLIQIQQYGSQLNPLAMFYMLIAVIVPSLSVTFVIVIAAFIGLSDFGLKATMWLMLGVFVFLQFMFLGIIKARRPNLVT